MTRSSLGTFEMAWFPYKEDMRGAPGSLVRHKDHYQPAGQGVLIYFTSQTGNLDDQLNRVEQAGGKVLKNKNSNH